MRNYLQNLVVICDLKDSLQTPIVRFFVSLTFLFLPLHSWGSVEDLLHEAILDYQKGIGATSFDEQQRAFNQSLSLFTSLEQDKSVFIRGLYEMIGDNYFQLGEYAWAILYYQRAFKESPPQDSLIAHLEKAQQKLGLPFEIPSFEEKKFLYKAHANWLFWALIVTFFACSAALWLPYSLIHRLALGSLLFLLILFAQGLFSYYSTPLEGVLIASTGFYRLPDPQQSQLSDQPLFAGSKIEVIQMASNGEWLKIRNSYGIVGYIPSSSFRLI